MTTTAQARRTISLPSFPISLVTVYVGTVVIPIAVFLGVILFTDEDPYANDGPVESMISIAVVSALALALGLAIGYGTVRSPEKARVGALVLGALSVVTIVFFWSGAPGILGVCAAWVAGLTRGGRPLGGAARAAGLVGIFVAALNVILSVGGMLLTGAV